MESHLVRTRYKLGTVLMEHDNAAEASDLIKKAAEGRLTLKGILPEVDDSVESYDSLVPYWAW